jgi:hypothetical protein
MQAWWPETPFCDAWFQKNKKTQITKSRKKGFQLNLLMLEGSLYIEHALSQHMLP